MNPVTNKENKSCIEGVACKVKDCSHHGCDNTCTANKITVGGATAHTGTETMCATFENRQG